MAFVVYGKNDEKAILKRDGYIILSKFFANPEDKSAKEDAIAFAAGSHDINAVIELLTHDIDLLKNDDFKDVVLGCLGSSGNLETPEFYHLSGLMAYAQEKEEYGRDLLEYIKGKNDFYHDIDKCEEILKARSNWPESMKRHYEKDIEYCRTQINKREQKLSNSKVEENFAKAMEGYRERARDEKNKSVAICDIARAFEINDQLHIEGYEYMNGGLHPTSSSYPSELLRDSLKWHNRLFSGAELGYYFAKFSRDASIKKGKEKGISGPELKDIETNYQSQMQKNYDKHIGEAENDFYMDNAIKVGKLSMQSIALSSCD